MNSKILIILAASETGSTAKIAKSISGVLQAEIKSPADVNAESLKDCSLIGFGSGIFDQKHHPALLRLAETLPQSEGKKVFLFSTCGLARKYLSPKEDPHTALRNLLQSKGYTVIGEFNCAGFNDNSFLKLFGGMNKGKPDSKDLTDAENFAAELLSPAGTEVSHG